MRIAVQMDDVTQVNVKENSTFALMLCAQSRGYDIWYYRPEDLSFDRGKTLAQAQRVKIQEIQGHPVEFLTPRISVDISKDVDVVLMRQDPPFDMAYITATYFLEYAQKQGTVVVNDPAHVRNTPEKLFVLEFPDLIPPTLITRSLVETQAFHKKYGDIVLKPLYGNGGKGIFHLDEHSGNMAALVDLFKDMHTEPFIVQRFLPEVHQGDKRIILVDGEPVGAFNRLPSGKDIRSNIAVGGTAEPAGLTPRDREICTRIGPELKRRGLIFVGIDVIGDYLTEINVTSPTGIRPLEAFYKTDTSTLVWDRIAPLVSPGKQ